MMLEITFEYRDKLSYPNWNTQTCVVNSVWECIKLYGLGENCEYKILSVETEENAVIRRKAETAANVIINAPEAPKLNAGAHLVLIEELKKVLTDAKMTRCYKAFEGDFRMITEDAKGNEFRYSILPTGKLKLF